MSRFDTASLIPFSQHIPVTKSCLTVKFRSISPFPYGPLSPCFAFPYAHFPAHIFFSILLLTLPCCLFAHPVSSPSLTLLFLLHHRLFISSCFTLALQPISPCLTLPSLLIASLPYISSPCLTHFVSLLSFLYNIFLSYSSFPVYIFSLAYSPFPVYTFILPYSPFPGCI